MLSLGGVLGVNARYWLGVWMNRWAATHWATFVINLSGSFAIGFLAMTLARWLPHPHFRLAILTGLLGGYTTFSTLAFESVMFWERGERGAALANLAGSVMAGFLAASLGTALARDVLISSWDRGASSGGAERVSGREPSARNRRLANETAGSPDLGLPPDVEGPGFLHVAKDGTERLPR